VYVIFYFRKKFCFIFASSMRERYLISLKVIMLIEMSNNFDEVAPLIRETIDEKKARIFMRALLKMMAVRGGLTRFARPAGSLLAGSSSVQRADARCRTPVGDSHPPSEMLHAKKKPAFTCELFLK
jgi:hypothetical protein